MAGGIIAAVGVVAAIGFTVGTVVTSPRRPLTMTTTRHHPADGRPGRRVHGRPDHRGPTTAVRTDNGRTHDRGPDDGRAHDGRPDHRRADDGPPDDALRPPPPRRTTVAPTTTTAGAGAGRARPPWRPAARTSIGSIVPDIAASRRFLATPQQVQTTVDQLLASGGRHDVALPGTVATLCATVELAGPIEVSGRWERDGEEISETGLVLRNAPGFGDCIDNDGEPLEPGSYQFVATDADGTDSAVANFVVDAVRIDQQFVNNGEDPVCAIFVAPTAAGFFEDYVFASPLPPGAAVVIPIADVRQDVQVTVCPGSEPREDFDFDFDPTPGEPQPLIP